MTDLKIKEKVNWNSGEAIKSDTNLETGTLLYSYNFDMLIMVVEATDGDGESDFGLVNLSNGAILNDDEEYFEDNLQSVIDRFGPLYLVNKAKIKFKVGE